MRVVAIAATNSLVKHFALQERTVNVSFVSDLAVGVVDRFLDRLHGVKFIEPTTGGEALTNNRATRVAGRTGFYLCDVAF